MVVISLILLALFIVSNGDEKKPEVRRTTTTTTLPPKDAQACEYLTPETLLAGGIIPDVEPKASDDKKRCEFRDIGGSVNYITLYVDERKICPIWLEDVKSKKPVPEINDEAFFFDDIDPTIVVPQDSRCFFVQGSKTLVTRETLTAIAKSISDLLIAVDTSTTTTTQTTVVLPEDTSVIPGVNTAAPSTTTTTAKP